MCTVEKDLPDVALNRFCYAPFGTFGLLTLPSGIVLATVEKPWLDNRPYISCIPEDSYLCKPRMFYRKGYMAIEITDVEGRSHILFHIANFVEDVVGCVGVNSSHGARGHEWCGIDSTNAFNQLMDELGEKEFDLEISSINGGILNEQDN